MQVTLLHLQSLDGYIAHSQDDNLSWGSSEDKTFFRQKTREIGTMLMGRKTFSQMPEKAFADRTSYVLTRSPQQFANYHNPYGNVHFLKTSPREALAHLAGKGITQIALIGGGNITTQFLENGLVDTLLITLAPVILGHGISGFGQLTQMQQFTLCKATPLSSGEVLLHYEKKHLCKQAQNSLSWDMKKHKRYCCKNYNGKNPFMPGSSGDLIR